MHQTWRNILQNELDSEYFRIIIQKVEEERKRSLIFPDTNFVFNSFNFDANLLKVVILGQDPYHDYIIKDDTIIPNANGLAFSSNNKISPSLKNIFKEIKNCYPNWEIPNNGNLEHWMRQGVLLLNSILTVESGKPASHHKIGWEIFTDNIIKTIDLEFNNIVFLLWGNFAKQKRIFIKNNIVFETVHPSPFSARNGFFGCNHFLLTNQYLTEHMKDIIIW